MNRVPVGKEKHEGGFKEAFDSLPYKERAKAMQSICAVCYWNPGTFRIKKAGKRYFSVFEAQELVKYFASHNIDAWTGNQLK